NLKKSGYFVIGLDGQAKDNISQINIDNQPTVLVFGSEGKGISYLALQTCDITAKIPIDKKVESLNVSVAAGITLWELFTCDENIYTN
ncbi:MAG: hypothetical protein LBT99_02280, partial [Bifidobacteriaceae bacterium]|nr:hypothetical protein [Bifidobacteriaceae bacterium]